VTEIRDKKQNPFIILSQWWNYRRNSYFFEFGFIKAMED